MYFVEAHIREVGLIELEGLYHRIRSSFWSMKYLDVVRQRQDCTTPRPQSDNFSNTARLIARIARGESILRQPDKQAELYFDEGL